MEDYKRKPFSIGWVFVSIVVFIVIELVLGGIVGRFAGGFISYTLDFTLRGILTILSYFIGGIIIGVISTGWRILEPAIGALISILFMWMITFLVPYSFFEFDAGKLLVGGCVAFVVAMVGAIIGERWAGKLDTPQV